MSLSCNIVLAAMTDLQPSRAAWESPPGLLNGTSCAEEMLAPEQAETLAVKLWNDGRKHEALAVLEGQIAIEKVEAELRAMSAARHQPVVAEAVAAAPSPAWETARAGTPIVNSGALAPSASPYAVPALVGAVKQAGPDVVTQGGGLGGLPAVIPAPPQGVWQPMRALPTVAIASLVLAGAVLWYALDGDQRPSSEVTAAAAASQASGVRPAQARPGNLLATVQTSPAREAAADEQRGADVAIAEDGTPETAPSEAGVNGAPEPASVAVADPQDATAPSPPVRSVAGLPAAVDPSPPPPPRAAPADARARARAARAASSAAAPAGKTEAVVPERQRVQPPVQQARIAPQEERRQVRLREGLARQRAAAEAYAARRRVAAERRAGLR